MVKREMIMHHDNSAIDLIFQVSSAIDFKSIPRISIDLSGFQNAQYNDQYNIIQQTWQKKQGGRKLRQETERGKGERQRRTEKTKTRKGKII